MGNRKEDTTNELKEDSNQARMKAAFDSGPLTPLALERSTSIPVSLLLTYLGDLRVQEYVRRCEVTVARGDLESQRYQNQLLRSENQDLRKAVDLATHDVRMAQEYKEQLALANNRIRYLHDSIQKTYDVLNVAVAGTAESTSPDRAILLAVRDQLRTVLYGGTVSKTEDQTKNKD